MTRFRKTRVNAQDMKTGQYADLSELIRDGYYPNLWVLPENYDPPQRSGPSIALPIEPIYNFSPPSTIDNNFIVMNNLFDTVTGAAISMPFSFGKLGIFAVSAVSEITGVSSTGSVGMLSVMAFEGLSSIGTVGSFMLNVMQDVVGVSSTGDVALLNNFENALVGVSSTGSTGSFSPEIVVEMVLTGVSSTGTVGVIPPGSGWSQGGGWSRRTWGSA